MAIVKTQGVVIKKRNLGEADKILIIFTRDLGKISTVAKGIRKTTSKFSGHLELLCVTDLLLAEGRNLYTLISAEISKCFFPIRNDLQHTSRAFLMAEMIDKIAHESEKNHKIYKLFVDSLHELGESKDGLILPYFQLQLLIEAGFRPHFRECMFCQKSLHSEKNYFSVAQSGILSGEHFRSDLDAIPLGEDEIKLLRFLAENSFSQVKKLKIKEDTAEKINSLLMDYSEYILESELKSNRFVQRRE